MPRRPNGFEHMEHLPLETRLAIDHCYQTHWYRHFSGFARGRSVLDAGAGTGYGLPILRGAGAAHVVGFDPLPAGPDVQAGMIEDFATESFDFVFCMDVVEHVEDDLTFYAHLCRVARRGVVITTPNWNVSKAENAFHVREYTPQELDELTREFSKPNRSRHIWVSDHILRIEARQDFDPEESWNNYGLLLERT